MNRKTKTFCSKSVESFTRVSLAGIMGDIQRGENPGEKPLSQLGSN